jgi:hypothetical protein
VASHQRIRQNRGYNPSNPETYGGVASAIDRNILDAPVAAGNGAKSYSSWTPTIFNYPSTPPNTGVFGINTAFMGQASPAPPGYMTGVESLYGGYGTNEGFYWNGASFTLINGIVGGEAKPFGISNLVKLVGHYYGTVQGRRAASVPCRARALT